MSSPSLIKPLIPLFHGLQKELLTQPAAFTAFLPMFRCETVSEDPDIRRQAQGSDLEISTLLTFFRDAFPRPSVSSPGLWHSVPGISMIDPTMIEIHGRLAIALSQDQSPRNISLLRFIVVVIILHQLAHAVASRFQKATRSMEHSVFPYYLSCRAPPVMRFPEHGFSVEEDLFGGMVGVVFENELDGLPPMFFRSDFTKIAHLFLHCRDGLTYRLDSTDLEEKMKVGRLTPFDVSVLRVIPTPKFIRDRTCAMFNGDHLVVHESAGGDPEPRDLASLLLRPVPRECGIRRWDPSQ